MGAAGVAKELLSLASVMEVLDCSPRQVRLLIEKGWLSKGRRFLGEVRWTREEVAKFKLDWLTGQLPPARKRERKRKPPKPEPGGS